jgi:hypothetical protein
VALATGSVGPFDWVGATSDWVGDRSDSIPFLGRNSQQCVSRRDAPAIWYILSSSEIARGVSAAQWPSPSDLTLDGTASEVFRGSEGTRIRMPSEETPRLGRTPSRLRTSLGTSLPSPLGRTVKEHVSRMHYTRSVTRPAALAYASICIGIPSSSRSSTAGSRTASPEWIR